MSPVMAHESEGFGVNQRTVAFTAMNAMAAMALYAAMIKKKKSSACNMVGGTRVIPVVQTGSTAAPRITRQALDQ